MDFHLSNEQLMLRKMYREFAENEVKPLAEEIDEEERFPMETVEKMAKLGMMGIYFPKEYGGAGGDVLSYAMCVEELAKVCGTTAVIVSAHTSLCCAPIFEHGTEEQKKKYLPDLLSGKKIGAFGLTEPNAGTDASGQQTTAVLEGDHYVLNGSKCFITNGTVDAEAAEEINKIFFEVIIAPAYTPEALEVLKQKKNRIILVQKSPLGTTRQFRSCLNGALVQDRDLKVETTEDLQQVTEKAVTPGQASDLLFANKIVKNSKSNAIVLAKGGMLLASGVGQTSRVDALRQAIEKARSFGHDLNGAVMASDAFFPFPDCVEIAGQAGITAVIHPGGSIRDNESVAYCNEHDMAMVITGFRHFKH